LQIAISKRLQHCRHAVKTVDSFEDGRNIYVVQELCCGGDLADLMSVSELLQPLPQQPKGS
jgi:serine/threonine protein kinase